ncbi:MAG TPA: carboxymuconolactone decarboxylase family protein [Candidatus Binatia bacterium]|nr:carboxymuconolactone decarboxylase family protein [Candidatus Binatia bacterium]
MAQLPDPLDRLDAEGRKVYERITARRGPIRGPYAPLMHHPALAEPVAALGEFLRFDGALPADVRELAILITARAVRQPFEWVMHEPIARRAGLPAEVIEHVRRRGDPSQLPDRYADAARVVAHVLGFESIPADLQARAEAALGVQGLLELVVLAGFYRLIAGVLFAFDVPLPAGERPPF